MKGQVKTASWYTGIHIYYDFNIGQSLNVTTVS